ncbi:TetR/AcrR family transcriptional regulator [Gordonia lacunae]|uniref:TetR/AcrR family transcriptional regulator n=1 Tax=Gordonia lacunae TaxID=417102 RepID=UPI0039E408DD
MSSTSTDRSYGGESAAGRTARRRAALVDAAATVMSDGRWRAATVAGLCTDAQLNKRYFYESFPDLDTLADAVIDDISGEVVQAAVGAYLGLLDRPLADQARGAVDAVVGVLGTDRRKARILLGGAAGTPAADERRTEAMTGLTAVLIEHARTIHDVELEADSLARTAPAFVIGGSAQAILAWAEGTLPVSRTDLVDDVSALWLALGTAASELARSRLESGTHRVE